MTGNDRNVQRLANDLATRYLSDPTVLPPTVAATVLDVAALNGDAALYESYRAQMVKLAASPEEYYRYLDALAWFSDPALIRRTLDYAISPAVRSQDVGLLLAGLMARPASRDATWAVIKAQWPTLVNRLDTFQSIPAIISATGNFCSREAAADVRQFFTQNPVSSSARTLQQGVERIEACAAMRTRQAEPLGRYLSK